MGSINLLGFLCEAFGQNQKIYKDIDVLYQKRKFEFYRIAKASELYNHSLIKEGSLLQEEYSKKILGIFLYQYEFTDDYEVIKDLNLLVEKGWSYVYNYSINKSEIDLFDFMKRFIRKNKGIENLTDDDLNTNLIVLIVFSLSIGKKIIQDEFYNNFMQILEIRLEHYKPENRLNVINVGADQKKQIEVLKNVIYEKFGEVKDYMSLLQHVSRKFDVEKGYDFTGEDPKKTKVISYQEMLAVLFDYENISSSIFNLEKFTNKDVDEILLLYQKQHQDLEKIDGDDLMKYFISSMYIKYLIKSYKNIKVRYFENNKETQFAEIQDKEKLITQLESKLEQKESLESHLLAKVEELTKKVNRITNEIESEKLKNNELNGLREFMFALDSKIEYKEIEPDYEKIKHMKIVILGGQNRWQQRLKEHLQEAIFISTDMINFDTNLLNGISDVFVYVNYLSHSIYYKLVDAAKLRNINIHYISHHNENYVLNEIQSKLGGKNEKI